jgi:hypothetical protein
MRFACRITKCTDDSIIRRMRFSCRITKCTDDSIIRRMRFSCWITKCTDNSIRRRMRFSCWITKYTDDSIIRRMRYACRITKATDTFRMYDTYCFSTAAMVNANAPLCYVIRALPVMLNTAQHLWTFSWAKGFVCGRLQTVYGVLSSNFCTGGGKWYYLCFLFLSYILPSVGFVSRVSCVRVTVGESVVRYFTFVSCSFCLG